MKKTHEKDESFVFQYILEELEQDKHIFIDQLCMLFGYHRTSIYKILVKINDNWSLMNYPYELEKINANEYKRVLNDID